ncbi:hypothetical protein [Streptosporangium sp. H16]|uniref:hypothetical protein n=1 Tax=Streptosporangium sp. H16 TaxID=3444184 RepID=UPI003F7A2AE8
MTSSANDKINGGGGETGNRDGRPVDNRIADWGGAVTAWRRHLIAAGDGETGAGRSDAAV